MTNAQLDIVADYRLKEMLATAVSLSCGAIDAALKGFGITLPSEVVAKCAVEAVKVTSTALGLATPTISISAEEAVIRVK